jgi:hypothetical protein
VARRPPSRLTLSQVNLIAFAARDGTADPEHARVLLELFCQAIERGQIAARDPVAARLTEHVREAFRAHIDSNRGIEAALGLARRRGRRKEANAGMQMLMAADVLRHRLSGKPHQSALTATEKTFGWGQTVISNAWDRYPQIAVAILRGERGSVGFTREERERLRAIFGHRPWFDCSAKSPD